MMIITNVIIFMFITGLCVLSVGLPFWVAWKAYFGNRKVFGVSVQGWVGPWAVIAGLCATILIVTVFPLALACRDAQAPVGVFFLGVVVCGLFPLLLLVGRSGLAVWRVSRGNWTSKDGELPEFVWILAGVGLIGVATLIVGVHWYSNRLLVEISNPNASPETIREVYTKSRPPWIIDEVKLKLAECPRLPHDVMAKLAEQSNDLSERVRIAYNSGADASVLVKLSGDADFWIRRKVATRDDCPAAVLEKLATDPQAEVRQAALKQLEKRKASPLR